MSKIIIRPNYAKYGKSAPLERNKEIVEICDMVVAIWDGKSRGTRYTIEYARKCDKKVVLYVAK